jgi:hypothetical protein
VSETFFRVMLADIKSLRLVCNCGSTMEISLDRLVDMTKLIKCQACDVALQRENNFHLAELAKKIKAINDLDYVDVGFSLPITSSDKPATK